MACYQAVSHFKEQNTMQYKLKTCTGVQAIESRCFLAKLLHWGGINWKRREKKNMMGKHIWCTGCLLLLLYSRAVKINALTQIHFNGTNFINARLMQRAFSI